VRDGVHDALLSQQVPGKHGQRAASGTRLNDSLALQHVRQVLLASDLFLPDRVRAVWECVGPQLERKARERRRPADELAVLFEVEISTDKPVLAVENDTHEPFAERVQVACAEDVHVRLL
jgi:hypothetical protein